MANLLDEIKEEIKQEEWQKFWFSYGLYAVVGAIVVLVLTGGYLIWSNVELRRAERQSKVYDEALVLFEAGQYAKAEERFKKLVQDSPGSGYAQLARVCLVGVAQRRALATYDKEWVAFWQKSAAQLTQDPEFNTGFRSALVLSQAYGLMDFAQDADIVEQQRALKAFESPENPWKGLSLEARGLWFMAARDMVAAVKAWQHGFKDATLSPSVRVRMEKGLVALGGEIPNAP